MYITYITIIIKFIDSVDGAFIALITAMPFSWIATTTFFFLKQTDMKQASPGFSGLLCDFFTRI